MRSLLSNLDKIQQKPGGTKFVPALRQCLKALAAYTAAGSETFDVCVLITDGRSSDQKSELDNLMPADTALFGIYVGSEQEAESALHALSTCGAANHSKSCHFFASASDFNELRQRPYDVAKAVTKGSDEAG